MPETHRLDHVGLAVSDLDRMTAWYIDMFGYAVEQRLRVDAVDLEIVMLIQPRTRDRLELLHRPGGRPGPRYAEPAAAALGHGFGHIAFDVPSTVGVDRTYAGLVSKGARGVMAPARSPEPGVRMAFVADPEGNLIEILDRRRDAFLWGAAHAGHQTEGGDDASDTSFAEHVEPSVFREPAGPACDGYARWRDDVDLAASLHLNAYRFSFEWSRIEPEPGRFAGAELDHYEAIVDRCLERGMTPVVTLNHFTAPHWFAADGGWLSPEAPERFGRYVEQAFGRVADRVRWVVTLNEPNLPRLLSWLHLPPQVREVERATLAAASAAAGVARYRLANVVLPEELEAMADGFAEGHRTGRAAVRAASSQAAVGFSLSVVDDVVVGDDPSVRDRKRAECYERWFDLARDDDFLGVQNYERMRYDAHGEVDAPAHLPRNQMGSAVEPDSLAAAVRYAHAAVGLPILVTEHGIATDDDTLRAGLIPAAVEALDGAIAEGVPVLGYLHWSLMDNFEWVFGFGHKLGLCEVDRDTFERRPKPSARTYADLVKAARGGSIR